MLPVGRSHDGIMDLSSVYLLQTSSSVEAVRGVSWRNKITNRSNAHAIQNI
jgi:hypothetical protein